MAELNKTGIKRNELKEIVPLNTPLVIHLTPTNFCNFKCVYCHQSLNEDQLVELKFKREFMDIKLYYKIIDDISNFKVKLKALVLAGRGEPLLHKNIVEMVRYAKVKNIAERIEITTNASLLTNKLSDELNSVGLDRLRVSLQGVSDYAYYKYCGISLKVEKIKANLKYFYDNKKKCKIYIKILDYALDSELEEKKFYDDFSDICDFIAIEHIAPYHENINYETIKKNTITAIRGNKLKNVLVCASPFYMMYIEPNGEVYPCCNLPTPKCYDNVNLKSLVEIWESDNHYDFLKLHLQGYRNKNTVCAKCQMVNYLRGDEDDLDEYKDVILGRLKK